MKLKYLFNRHKYQYDKELAAIYYKLETILDEIVLLRDDLEKEKE